MKKTVDWTKTYSQIVIKKAHHTKQLYLEYLTKRAEIISEEPKLDHSKWDGMTEAAMNYRQQYNNGWEVIQGKLQTLNAEYWPKIKEVFKIRDPLTYTQRLEEEDKRNERREKKLQKKQNENKSVS